MHRLKRTLRCLYMFTGSTKWMWIIVGCFLLQAISIALLGRYPMAFDEDFHMGVIRIYAGHAHPFMRVQPVDANQFGALTRDPSYLYHFIMSFPYRLFSACTTNQHVLIVLLRVINAALLASSLPVFRLLLRRCGMSLRQSHAILNAFILIPIVPFLGAQINYDNMLIPLVALTLLMTSSAYYSLLHGKINFRQNMVLISVCMLTSLVKYAFIPIFLAILGVLGYAFYRGIIRQRRIIPALRQGWQLTGVTHWPILLLAVALSVGLFTQRIGVNIVHYKSPAQDCSKVLSIDQCSAYGPWLRDYTLSHAKGYVSPNPISYDMSWFYGMWLRLFFAVGGPQTTYETRGPFLLPAIGAIIFSAIGVVLSIYYWRKTLPVLRRPATIIALLASLLYVAVLWLDEFHMYLRTGQPVAINGRYLLPVLPILLVLVAAGYAALASRYRRIAVALVVAGFLCLLGGGGMLTYVLRSNDTWNWPDTRIQRGAHAISNTLGPLTPGYTNPIEFL